MRLRDVGALRRPDARRLKILDGLVVVVILGLLFTMHRSYADLQGVIDDLSDLGGSHDSETISELHHEDDPTGPLPPTYEEFYNFERNLPQHDLSLPFPEGASGRYFFVGNYDWRLAGIMHCKDSCYMPIFHTCLAAALSLLLIPGTRQPRTVSIMDAKYLQDMHNPHLRHGRYPYFDRIPWTAYLTGPAVGGCFPHDASRATHPRSVMVEYWEKACPTYTTLNVTEIHEAEDLWDADGIDILETWTRILQEMPDRCVMISDMDKTHIFDYYVLGSKRIHSLLPSNSKSPIFTDLGWSQLITSAIARNAHIWGLPMTEQGGFLDPKSDIPELLVVHLRRGDYIQHCKSLVGWKAPYMGWAQLPDLPDQFEPPWGASAEEWNTTYAKHCLPDVQQIVERIELVHAESSLPLSRLYVMTNADAEFLSFLKKALHYSGSWKSIATSRELELNLEQKYIAQAIDAAIALRAPVFLGNGFSTVTSNTVWFRTINGRKAETMRFW